MYNGFFTFIMKIKILNILKETLNCGNLLIIYNDSGY